MFLEYPWIRFDNLKCEEEHMQHRRYFYGILTPAVALSVALALAGGELQVIVSRPANGIVSKLTIEQVRYQSGPLDHTHSSAGLMAVLAP